MSAAGATWSAEQRRVLGVLGYALYDRITPVSASVRTMMRDAPTLAIALRRAAGLGDDEALPFVLPRADTLRTAAGKRALWPALRALRRGR